MPCRMDDMLCSSCGELSHSGACDPKIKHKWQGYREQQQSESIKRQWEALPNKEKAPAYLLCEACSLLEDAHIFLKRASKELQQWFASHEKCEEHRVRYEAAQKLSQREQRL